MESITFTNNLSRDLMEWMESYSSKEKITRRAVIERALNNFRKSERQKEYANSFKKAKNDLEIKNMAEDGMADYFKQLSNLER